MQQARFAIVGGGLAGLHAAYLLECAGIHDYVLLEARPRLGGRIQSAEFGGAGRFDLGATWFWPDFQPGLDALVRELGLERFPQPEAGEMVFERSSHERPMRVPGQVSSPPSMRLAGGLGALVGALQRRLDPSRIVIGQRVRRMHCSDAGVLLDAEDEGGRTTRYRCASVLLAVPPRLAAAGIAFEPALPPTLAQAWPHAATWMAPHAKYVAVYDRPFWREQGLSGEARSAAGPLGEIHDASHPQGPAALFGFFAVPARVRATVPQEVLKTHCRAQLARLFGPAAAAPRAEFLKDWASDACTATAADQDADAQHARAPAAAATGGVWQGRLIGIASEWSPQFPGYAAGAIEAAGLGVRALAAGGTSSMEKSA